MKSMDDRTVGLISASSSRASLKIQPEIGYPRICDYCQPIIELMTASEFARHIRQDHTTKEGGSFLCRYGEHGVCQKLPLEGVCDLDFEAHIRRCHTSSQPAGYSSPTSSLVASYTEDSEETASLRSIRLTSDRDTPTIEKKKFTLHSFTQNLSAVLADPSRSRSDLTTFFTRHWGDSFVPTQPVPQSKRLARLADSAFDSYCQSAGESYRRYQAIKRALRLSHADGGVGIGDERQDAEDLPTIFIDPRFTLGDSSTFSDVFTVPANDDLDALKQTLSGRNVIPATPLEIATNRKPGEFRDYEALQNRLEMMHDVVDGRLAGKLVAKTDDFWQVVRSYSGLQEQLANALQCVMVVRKNLKRVDELVCDQSKKIVEVHERYEQKKKLLAKLHDISCLREAQSTVQMMLSQGDYPKAIECIETSLDVLSKELNGVTCFRHLASQLRELYTVIGRMMNEDFASLIQKELGVKPEAGTMIQAEGELSAVLLGLMRMRKYSFIAVLREEIIEGVKSVMRQVIKNQILNNGVDLNDFDPSLTQLGEPVRRMKHADFLKTVKAVMDEEFYFCKRLEALQDILLETVERANPLHRHGSEDIIVERIEEAKDIHESESDDEVGTTFSKSASSGGFSVGGSALSSNASATTLLSIEVRSEAFLRHVLPLIAEFGHQCAQQRISRLLIARAKNASVTEATTPTQLSECIKLVKEFQSKCDKEGWYSTQNQKVGGLGRSVNKLSMDYIEKFHAARKIRIGNMLDTELWKATDVSIVDQNIVDMAMETGQLRNTKRIDDGPIKKSFKRTESAVTIDSTTSTSNQIQGVIVDEENYVVVGSSITMIQLLSDYCEAISEMPSFSQDWNSRVVELLKTFNSRCCQLILGAGALQLVGLKTISVRNLALAGRSLELVCRFIPMVHDEMDRVLPENRKSLLRYFKQVESEYRDHVNEIAAKLISVIAHYTTNCLGMWDVKGVIPSPEFQQICRHMLKFHNGLVGIMPRDQIEALFRQVHENFKANLREHVTGMGITPHDPLKYGYVTKDYMFYQQNVKNMESCRNLELESLNDIMFE
ncbi:Vacuolar protein sorting-associated protein 54 [Caenorhabditis elegans]|uniref:Vacuolar protein sorting-associated protein 54 n=2 Tax=Caenorhabditis elegans TaxID=6239 RepID=VPS54_CAEEL|nr:Vacuolar protein sorting-associated protein 54 [Caenorhabditis elegans]Q22639.2 RecName: Full=Vacuolar protein sorting-associated protein 54 [Caenorhabditis elegans]CAA97331.2 Vacuolar protein sorting-associated protein 54 [Caenorhabditis elegans]|eukprot:NP_001256226.1 Vacuolar protein sorting-associated protein 54 [Caenorhabditis elegans]